MTGSSHPHLASAVACRQCDALNFKGATSCAECGAPLDGHGAASEHPAVTAKREASAALRNGYRSIGAVTWLFRLGAGAYGAVTAVAVMALADTDVPVGPGLLVVTLSALLTALMLVGAIQILFQPLAWTLAAAILATVATVAHLIGPNPLGVAFLWSGAWAVAFWVAVLPMLRFRRLMSEHMDLYITHHANHRTVRALAGRSPQEQHERLLNAMYRASRRAWWISAAAAAAICLASTLGAYTVCARSRPEQLPDAIARFEEAWNRSSLTAVDEMFVPFNRASQSRLLAGLVASHGWKHGLPRVRDGRQRTENDRLWIDYDVEDATVSTRWVLEGPHWQLVEVALPRPSHLPTVERFLDAWGRSDLEALGTLFRADTRGEMVDAVEQAMKHRGWQHLPKVLDKSSSETDDGEIVMTLRTATGDVTATLAFRSNGKWGVRSIKFPAS